MQELAWKANAAPRGSGSAWPAAGRLLLAVAGTIAVGAMAQEPSEQPAATQAPLEAPALEDSTPPQEPGPARITAVWKERKLSFIYGGTATVYSCDALEARVASVLRAVGARDDVKVRASGCSEGLLPDPRMGTPVAGRSGTMSTMSDPYRVPGRAANTHQQASVYIKAMLPVEVTDDVQAELEKDKTRRDLVARVTGNPAARFNDPIVFAAQRQQVTISSRTVGLEPEECQLLDQLTTTVLPQIDVRVVSRTGTLCPAGSSLPPQIVVDALMPFYGDAPPSASPTAPAPSPPATEKQEPQGGEPPSNR